LENIFATVGAYICDPVLYGLLMLLIVTKTEPDTELEPRLTMANQGSILQNSISAEKSEILDKFTHTNKQPISIYKPLNYN
jgi:hypothetical protein